MQDVQEYTSRHKPRTGLFFPRVSNGPSVRIYKNPAHQKQSPVSNAKLVIIKGYILLG